MSQESKSPKESRASNNEPIEDDRSSQQQDSGRSMSPLAIVAAVIVLLAFILIVIATPLDVFRANAKNVDGSRNCYSMWGSKLCGPHKSHRNSFPYHGFSCKAVDQIMTCAAAFAIISIFFTLVTMILGFLAGCGCMSSIIPGILSILTTIFLCICFACQAGARNKTCTIAPPGFASEAVYIRIRGSYKYGAAFGLSVTAFCLQFIAMIFFFIAMAVGGKSSNKSKEEKEDKADSHDADAE